ncbi:MAG: serine/threonine-protein kinase [Gemmataceae bacterium]
MIGDHLGKWVIFKEIGRGGMGQVFLAREEIGGRQAAIKVLSAELSQDPGFLQRFQREADILAKLSHPGIVQFYEAGVENGVFFYAMEYVEGESLDEVLLEKGKLPWPEVLDVALQVCPALRHVHDHGVIHRDLKPSNLLRTADGKIKLTDFGIAKMFAATHLTATGGVVGTAEYLSPEQAAGKQVGKRSDLYCLGVVLYHLVVGRPPFEGKTMVDLLHKHIYSQFDPPRRYLPEIPYEIDELICQLMEKDPAKRPADCHVLGKQLERMRRRLDRKSQPTQIVHDGTVADARRTPREPGGPGPATLMSELMRDQVRREAHGGPVARFFNRFWVLFPLFLLCLAFLIWTFWPLNQETLYARGAALMETGRLADMERAWRDYFEPLDERYPDHPYRDKLRDYKIQLETARSPRPSEAQRFYHLGERLLEEGKVGQARKLWSDLITVFGANDAERDWVKKAERGLDELESKERVAQIWEAAQPALKRAAALRAAGKRAEATKTLEALDALYRDDPGARRVLIEVERLRGK